MFRSILFIVLMLPAAAPSFAQASAVDRIDHAYQLLQQGRAEDARAELEEVLEADPGNPRAAAYLATAEIQLGDSKSAIERARKLLAADPDNADWHLLLGQALAADEEWKAAEQEFRRVVTARPNSEGAHIELARALLQLSRFDDALAEADRAVVINPRRSDAHALKGSILAAQGKTADAIAAWDQALARDPNDAGALAGLAMALKERQPDTALEYARRSVELTNWHAVGPIRILVAVYRARGDVEAARQTLEKALGVLPDNAVLEAERRALGPTRAKK